MFENWKVKDTLLLGYAVPLVLFGGFSAIVHINTSKTIDTFDQVNKSHNTNLMTDDAVLRMSLMARQVRGYLLVGNSENALAAFEREKNKFDKDLNDIQNLIKDQRDNPQLQKYKRMLELASQFDALARKTFSTVDAGKQKEAVDTYLPASKIILGEFDKLNTEITDKIQDESKKDTDNTKKTLDFISLTSIILPLIALGIALTLAYLITQKIASKIAVVANVAEKISEGDLTSQIPAIEADDEIGKLQQSFQVMNQSLNSLIRRIQESGISITTSATQIAASGKQLEATMTEQVASTNEVAATAKEISATSSQLVKTMDEVEAKSQSTAQAAGVSQKELISMEKSMRQLADATTIISAKLGVINEKASSINSIVTTITKVADQTNLLSLNAAIEAEKAGEYGTGFAVVAREIRRLADQTAVATLDIENMVKDMQGAVSTGVMEMDKFSKQVESGVDDVRNIGTKLESIIQEVQTLTPQFQDVSNSMEGQSHGALQISQTMVQLSEASSQTAQSLREVNGAISQLNNAAQNLHQEIARFRVNSN